MYFFPSTGKAFTFGLEKRLFKLLLIFTEAATSAAGAVPSL